MRSIQGVSMHFVKKAFLNKFLNLQKLDVLCPGRFVSWTFRYWTFGNWTFCILDVLYPGCSVTGRLVTGRFVTGRYVTGRFVGVPSPTNTGSGVKYG